MVEFGQSGCIWAQVVVIGKVVEFGKKCFYSGIVVVIEQSGCTRAKWLYSDKSGCVRAKVVVFGQSGCIRAKVVAFEQK